MKRIAGVLILGLAAGCATSYKHVLETGYKSNWESTRRPAEVTSCIVARAQREPPWRAVHRPLNDRGSIEVIIGGGAEGVAAVAHVNPSPYGSRIDSWMTSRAVITRDIWHEQFFGGC